MHNATKEPLSRSIVMRMQAGVDANEQSLRDGKTEQADDLLYGFDVDGAYTSCPGIDTH
jgi:hypothetical protein